jgi:hypothetical protein
MEGLKPNKVGRKYVPTPCPRHGEVDNCCLCPGGYDCLTHTLEGGYCKNDKYTKSTSGIMTNARDVCNHCMSKRRIKESKDNCASALLELNKDAYDIESIKKYALALLSLEEEKKEAKEAKDNCASALLELNKDAYDIESIKKCALALLSLEEKKEEKKGEEPPRKKPKKDGKRKVKSRRRKSKSRRRKSKSRRRRRKSKK